MVEDKRQEQFKVIVLNLTNRVKNAHIEEIFAQYGKINYVDVVHGKPSPQFEHSGKAYISFATFKAQQDAIELMKGGVIDGARIEVDELKPLNRLTNQAPNSRGGRPTREYGKLREQRGRTIRSRSRSPVRNYRYSRRSSPRKYSRSPSPRRRYSRSPSPRSRPRFHSRSRSPRRSRSPARRNYSYSPDGGRGRNSPSKYRY